MCLIRCWHEVIHMKNLCHLVSFNYILSLVNQFANSKDMFPDKEVAFVFLPCFYWLEAQCVTSKWWCHARTCDTRFLLLRTNPMPKIQMPLWTNRLQVHQYYTIDVAELEFILTSLETPELLKDTNVDCPLRGEIFQDTHLSKAEKRTDLICWVENLVSRFWSQRTIYAKVHETFLDLLWILFVWFFRLIAMYGFSYFRIFPHVTWDRPFTVVAVCDSSKHSAEFNPILRALWYSLTWTSGGGKTTGLPHQQVDVQLWLKDWMVFECTCHCHYPFPRMLMRFITSIQSLRYENSQLLMIDDIKVIDVAKDR